MSPRRKIAMSLRIGFAAAFAALSVAACAEQPAAETKGDVGAIAIAGTVRDAESGAAVDGVRVCVVEPAAGPCVDTAGGGAYRLGGVPVESRAALTFERAGSLPTLVPLWTAHA